MSYPNEDRTLITEEEFATGLADLQVRGLVEYRGEDEIRLTDSGLDRAFDTWFSMSPVDRIVMRLFMERVDTAVKEKEHGS